jgi:hypothetical protein
MVAHFKTEISSKDLLMVIIAGEQLKQHFLGQKMTNELSNEISKGE